MSSLSSSSQLFLPPGTPFPINVVKIQAKTSDSVQRGSPLLTYSFTSRPSEPGGRTQVLFGIWDCPVDGTIERWCVKERDVITSEDKAVVYVSEPCKHGVQMGGLCALCGKDMTQSDYTGFSNEARASIQMTHSANGPKVSLEEAQRIERETAMHLFSTRKLSLIVDLDQTIVHATVDPTVGDWIAEGEAWEARQGASSEAESDSDQSSQGEDDQVNPNWEALKDVKKFRLSPESFGLPPSPDGRRAKGKEKAVETQGCLYYVKPRPGCHDFLSSVATKYEMHVYTMGTRAYAEEVCKAIDPDAKFFGGRILSRDESGSLTQKSLQRLFPVDTSMVVIIDDRADVWEWSPNLVKVIPYDFFVGIGDINSTFLPKLDASTSGMPQMSPTPLGRQPPAVSGSTLSTSAPGPVPHDSQSTSVVTTSAEEHVTEEILQKEMIARNSLALEAQVEERPLAKLQEELQEAANGQLASDTSMSDTASGQSENSSKTSDAPGEKHHRKALLKNDDTELQRVKRLLDAIHEQFFEAYDNRAPDKERTKFVNKAQPSSSVLYDIRIIIPGLRFQTFDGLHILFSSVIPLDARPESTDIWNLAEAFGATCYTELTREVTHLVAAKRGTAKIDQARKRGNIKIVWLAWFTDSIARWERQDESPYLMDEPLSLSATAPDTASSPAPPDAQQISSDPEPDADDWDVEPGSGNGGSGAAAPGMAAAQGSGTMYEEELDDLKRISEQSQSLELSLSWEDADEELREFLASGDEEDEDEDEEGDGNGDDGDGASSKDMGHTSESARKNDQRLGGETGSVDGGSAPSSPRTRRKRLRSLTPSEAGLNASDDDLLRSPLSKRKKLAKDRQNASKLKESISPEEFAPPTVPSPREEDEEEDEEDDESIFGDGFEDDFLARELEEEMG